MGKRSKERPEIEGMDATAVLRLLFHGLGPAGASSAAPLGLSLVPPPGWPKGCKPSPSMAIDEEIERLLTPRSRTSIALRADALAPCPYYGVRFWIAVSADAARREVDVRESRDPRIEGLDRVAHLADDLAKGLDRFVEACRGFREDPETGEAAPYGAPAPFLPSVPAGARHDHRAENALRDQWQDRRAVLLHAADTLRALAGDAAAAREAVPANKGEVWRAAFVRVLAGYWTGWTGRKVTNAETGAFWRFLDATWASLGRTDGAWKSPIDRALRDFAARPEWDRPESRKMDPPGTKFITADEMAERRRAAFAQEDDALRKLGIDPSALSGRGKKRDLN